MSGSAAGDSAAATDQDGHCKVHTSIKLKHRKRNGEWTQLMKGCPLCSADDDDSTWSSSKGGCSPRSNHPASPTKTPGQRKRLPSVSPRTSRFKECKDDELYPGAADAAAAPSPRSINGCIVIDDETTEASSEDNSAQARQLRVRVTSSKLPPLPFSQEKVGALAAPCAGEAESKVTLVDKPECASSLEQLITERKEKIRELRIRRLVPPSQRYQPAATSGEERGIIRSSKDFHYSEASHHMGNVVSNLCPTSNVPGSVTIDKIDKIYQSNNKKWNSSFHSAATEQAGNISSDDGEGSHHMGRVISSFHLESTKHENNLTANGGEMQAINVPPNTDSEQPTSKGSDQGSNEQRFEASSLEISYDSFVEQMGGDLRRGQSTQRATEFLRETTDQSRREDVELRRASSGDITVVRGNTSSNKQSVPAPPNRPVIEVHMTSPERRDDLHKATRNIWSSVDVEHVVRRKHGSSESVIKSRSFGDEHKVRKGGQGTTVPGLPRSVSFGNIRWNNDQPKRYIKSKSSGNEQYDSWRQPSATSALNQSNIVKDINNRLDSLHIGPAEGSRKSTKRRAREREQVVVRDVSSDEEGDEYFRRGDVSHGQEPPGRRSSVKMQDKRKDAKKSSAHHTKAGHHMPDMAYSDEESDSSYDTLVNEGLDDYMTAFGQVNESSPQVTRERKRLRLHSKRQEKERSSEPLAGNISRASSACSGKELRSSSSERKPCAERATQKYPPPPPRRLSRSRKETRSPRSSSRKAGPTRSADAKSSHNDRHSESSPRVLPPPPPHPPKYDGGYERQDSDSSQESEKIFNQVDSHGCCIRHPHVQLRRKRRLGGWKKARWKTIMMNCTECCFEEVQRLRQKNDRTKEELISQASPPLRSDKHYDTSTTASLSTESSEESGSGVFIQVPKSILKNRPGHDSSSNLDGSDQGSDGTTTFSYLSSLSGSSFSAGLSSASSVYGDYGKRPRGILRKNGSKGSNTSSKHSSRGSSRNSRSSDGRVVFAGRDHVINIGNIGVQFQFDV